MKKLLTVFLMLIMSVILFSGCASVNYSIQIMEDGTVEQSFTVNLNEQELNDAGYQLEDVEQMIVGKMNTVVSNAYTNFANRNLSTDIKQQVLNSILASVTYPDTNSVKLTLTFNSLTVYRYFYGSLPESDDPQDTTQTETHLFYDKYIDENQTVYYDLQDNSIAQSVLDYFGGDFTFEDSTYSFSYGTPLMHLYSNADEISVEDGVKVHTWNFTYDQVNDNILTYTIGINSGAWYFLALGMVIIFIGGLIAFDQIKKRKKHKKVLLEKK